jgi:23S rRNA pseudouridine955/2504/2580 synthase
MTGVQLLPVAAEDAGTRLDRWFHRAFPQVTQGQIQKLLRTGQIRVDGKRAEANVRLAGGETIRVPPLPDTANITHKQRDLGEDRSALERMILYRDDWVIALNKPAGLAVQGGTKQEKHLDGMLEALADGGDKPRLVHRLDKDTSGVLLVARTRQAAQRLTASFRGRETRKYYWAITIGVPKRHQGRIDAALVKQAGARGERMEIDDEDGREAVTLYQVVDHAVKAAWVALWPLTGRTHQLRAHMELLGTPILGDHKYDVRTTEISIGDLSPRLHLHARRLVMPHPSRQGTIDVTAPLPDDLKSTWKYFGFAQKDGDPFAGIDP